MNTYMKMVNLGEAGNITECIKSASDWKKALFLCRDVDFDGGVNVTWGSCGSSKSVPPTIFDRLRPHPYDPLVDHILADWHMRIRPPRPID
jgi:hypothetical protein